MLGLLRVLLAALADGLLADLADGLLADLADGLLAALPGTLLALLALLAHTAADLGPRVADVPGQLEADGRERDVLGVGLLDLLRVLLCQLWTWACSSSVRKRLDAGSRAYSL